jgi:hypothetical protein
VARPRVGGGSARRGPRPRESRPSRGSGAGAGADAGPASADGPEVRRRLDKREKHFQISIFKEFSNISFQIPF